MSNDEITKARGVAEQAGPPPGPPPRAGLEWNQNTHRWNLPNDYQKWYLGAFASVKNAEGKLKAIEALPIVELGSYDKQGKPHDCIGNAFKFARQNGEKVMTGYLLDLGKEKNFSRHTWNAKDGKVIEHTPMDDDWDPSESQYRGVEIAPNYQDLNAFDDKINRISSRVSSKAGPAPGPPPRPGLVWNDDSHRWIRPEDEALRTKVLETGQYSSAEFIKAVRSLSPDEQLQLGKHICWETEARQGAYFSNMDRKVTIKLAKYIDKEYITDMNDPNFMAIEGAAEDMMRHGSDPEARKIAYKTCLRHPIPKSRKFMEDVYGKYLMTGDIGKDIDTAVSGYEATAGGAQANWLKVAVDKIFNDVDSEHHELGSYTYRFPEHEYFDVIKKLYDQTQEFYKKKGITHITLHRGLTKERGEVFHLRDSDTLTSWTTDKTIATFHAKRGYLKDKHYSAYIMTVNMPVENILYSYETVPQLKTKTFRDVIDEDKEFIVIKKKDQTLFKDMDEALLKGNTDGQGDRFRITPDTDDAEDKPVVRSAFDNIVEFEGRKYVELGNTFRTDIDVEPGAVIEVSAQELVMSQNRLSWDKPRVSGVDLTRATPYTLDTTLSIAQRYENTIIKADKRSASQDDLDEPAEGGRDKFDVKVGDSGVLTIDEHITFLDEDAAREFIGVTSYEGWNNTKQGFSRRVGAVHSDVRILNHGSDFLQGFTATVGGMKDRNKLVDNQDGDRILVPSFKAPTTHGRIKWQSEVGQGKAWIFEPGEIGSPGNRWSAIFKIERKAKVVFGKIDDHSIEMKISGTRHMPEGRWVLIHAPVEPNHSEWLLMKPKDHKFRDERLNDKPREVRRVSLLKTILDNRNG
jgi:hypothetical protein